MLAGHGSGAPAPPAGGAGVEDAALPPFDTELPPRLQLRARTHEVDVEAFDLPADHPIRLPEALEELGVPQSNAATPLERVAGAAAEQEARAVAGADPAAAGGDKPAAGLFLYQQLLERALHNTQLSRAVADLLTGGAGWPSAPEGPGAPAAEAAPGPQGRRAAAPAAGGAARYGVSSKFPARRAPGVLQQPQQQSAQHQHEQDARRMHASRIFKQPSLDATHGSRSLKVRADAAACRACLHASPSSGAWLGMAAHGGAWRRMATLTAACAVSCRPSKAEAACLHTMHPH